MRNPAVTVARSAESAILPVRATRTRYRGAHDAPMTSTPRIYTLHVGDELTIEIEQPTVVVRCWLAGSMVLCRTATGVSGRSNCGSPMPMRRRCPRSRSGASLTLSLLPPASIAVDWEAVCRTTSSGRGGQRSVARNYHYVLGVG